MGFDHYALIHHVDLTPMRGDLSHIDDGTLVALTNYPEAWVEAYVARNIVANDPILLASNRASIGFRWSDIGNYIEVTPEHVEVTREARRAGLEEGFTIPANLPGEASGSCNFATRTGRSLDNRCLAAAQLIGSFAFQAARTMVMRARLTPTASAVPALTPRQLDCMVLVARGKTDWEIGQILGLHEQTVTAHLNEARRRCGVDRRAQLVVYALYKGYLTFADVLEGKWR
jgi:LuxR family quorum-sensing system transcriptional regulator CciR